MYFTATDRDLAGSTMATNQFLSLRFPALPPHPGHCYSYSSEQLAPISRKKAEGPSRSSTLPLSLAPFFINPVGPCRVPAHPFTFPGASHHSGSQTAGHRYLCPSLCLPKAPDGTPIVMTMTSGPTSDRQRGHFHLKRLIQFKFE